MHLKRLHIHGFKTFANKTALDFLPPTKTRCPITAVVGPNGSGKSNLSDAIRWVLGEQSMKMLRGKKSEDIIFSGSEGKGRSGMAEVVLHFDNTDGAMPIEFSEVEITRRLYRDGTSEYLLNDKRVRLSDIHLLLAQANVGQRSYSVVSQGMIDHILVSTPEERKAFFDDATGVKQFQIKRHEGVLKLKRTYENLREVEMVLQEIEPRLRSLKRQVSRLEKRGVVEEELFAKECQYYGSVWWTLHNDLRAARIDTQMIKQQVQLDKTELETLEKESLKVAKHDEQGEDAGLVELQRRYRDVQKLRTKNREEQFQTEKEIELTKVRAQSNWAPLPLTKIVQELKDLTNGLKGLRSLKEITALIKQIDTLFSRSKSLLGKLERPNPEDIKTDPKLITRLKELKSERAGVDKKLSGLEKEIDGYAKKEKKVRSEFYEMQKVLREKQHELHALEGKQNSINITLARLEEREQALLREMGEFLKDRIVIVKKTPPETLLEQSQLDDLYPEIQRLRYKLEMIGGIDPEVIKEFEETKERFDFMDGQVSDLQGAITSTEKIINELDDRIEKQSKKVFASINKEFVRYFKILFGGGTCSLVKLTRKDVEETDDPPDGVSPERAFADTGEEQREKEDAIASRLRKHRDRVVGVDIQATPPGKRMKALNLLSGGERALTSIALISAIMSVNPSPFVVLDEVDAALDESNTVRFAAILQELSEKSQFIIITHNRATMEQADVLYGVTMGDDGISNLLSVHLEDVTAGATARR